MHEGVALANVFVCCLTDAYVHSKNCMREFTHAIESHKLIVPVLLPGYCPAHKDPPWPPPGASEAVEHSLANLLYVDLRTTEKRAANWPSLVRRIDSEVRGCRISYS